MLSRKVKWYPLFETKQQLEDLFVVRSTVVHRSMFGEALLIKEGNEFYAFQNSCPHQSKPLDGCSINEGNVVCPFHKYQFSLDDGRGHGLYLEKYELRIDERGVFLGKEGWSLF